MKEISTLLICQSSPLPPPRIDSRPEIIDLDVCFVFTEKFHQYIFYLCFEIINQYNLIQRFREIKIFSKIVF